MSSDQRDASSQALDPIFVLGTPESGAERLVHALACLPGLTAVPVPTHVASQGMALLLDTWTTRIRAAMGEAADDEQFLVDARRLAAAPLDAWAQCHGGERVVEHSPDHIGHAAVLTTLFPDAQFLHVVRDGRQVAASLASALWGWTPTAAVQRWCNDQRAVGAVMGSVDVQTARIEDVVADPGGYVARLAGWLGVRANDEAVAALGGRGVAMPPVPTGRVGTMVEVAGGDLLEALGYSYDEPSGPRRWAARAATGPVGEVGFAIRDAVKRFSAAAREDRPIGR